MLRDHGRRERIYESCHSEIQRRGITLLSLNRWRFKSFECRDISGVERLFADERSWKHLPIMDAILSQDGREVCIEVC